MLQREGILRVFRYGGSPYCAHAVGLFRWGLKEATASVTSSRPLRTGGTPEGRPRYQQALECPLPRDALDAPRELIFEDAPRR